MLCTHYAKEGVQRVGVRPGWIDNAKMMRLQAHQRGASLYAVLDVASDASTDELKKAYRREALRWHPDKHAGSDGGTQVQAEEKFRELQAAWAVLGDEQTRAAYDDDLEQQQGGA